MANRTRPNRIKAGWGAKFLNPNYNEPSPDERKIIQAHGEPFDNRKWITTGCHGSRLEAQQYVAKHYPWVKTDTVRVYGIRMSVRFFDDQTQQLLDRLNAKGFSGGKG